MREDYIIFPLYLYYSICLICKGENMNKYKRKSDFKDKIIERKTYEIESLKELISNLQIACEEKDEIINAVDVFHKELKEIIDDLKESKKEYDALSKDLFEMRKVLNQTVFNNKWRIIKWLMK